MLVSSTGTARGARWLVLVAVGLVVAYVLVTAAQVVSSARARPPAAADAIVVLGAAQYNGRPSPALQARLDRAVELYRQNVARQVWVTGGQQPGDTFSEASASDVYLQRHGIPRDALRLETQGANTYESLAAAARYLRREGARRVVLVSDRWHSYRLLSTAAEVGLEAQVAPARTPTTINAEALERLSRETLAVAVGRLIGYRRLSKLDDA